VQRMLGKLRKKSIIIFFQIALRNIYIYVKSYVSLIVSGARARSHACKSDRSTSFWTHVNRLKHHICDTV